MSRGLLDTTTLTLIADKLPNLDKLEEVLLPLAPDCISCRFAHESTIPIAVVCLQDTIRTLKEARYALGEVYAHRIYYLEKSAERKELSATYYAKFYSDDVALRLYAAAEHLANAIVATLEIDRNEITQIKKLDKKTSLALAVGIYLLNRMPDHPISKAVSDLKDCEEWTKAIDYRNKWVHAQPPLLEGMGIVWRREKLWEDEDWHGVKAQKLTIGSGAAPDYKIDEVINFVERALEKVAQTTETVLNFYIGLLTAKGFRIEGKRITFNAFG